MNQGFQNILLEYLLDISRTGNRETNTRRNRNNQPPPQQRNSFHQRQMDNRHMDAVSNMIYQYNQSFNRYQDNMGQMIRLLEQIHQANHPPSLASFLQNIDLSFNTTPLPTTQPHLDSLQIPTPPIFPSTDDWESITRIYLYPPTERTPISAQNRYSQYFTTGIIENATRTFFYSTSGETITDTRCPISLDDFRDGDELCQIMGCNHVFKRAPLMNWFSRNNRCPVCRYNLFDYQRRDEPMEPLEPLDEPMPSLEPLDEPMSPLEHLPQAGSREHLPQAGSHSINDISHNYSQASNRVQYDTWLQSQFDQEFRGFRNIFQSSDISNNEMIRQISNIFSDFMENPTSNQSYVLDLSNNGSTYRFDFTMY